MYSLKKSLCIKVSATCINVKCLNVNVFLRGNDCLDKSLNYFLFSSFLCILHVKKTVTKEKLQVHLNKFECRGKVH